MKGTLITEKNANQIAGRLRKFLNGRTFLMWQSFEGGGRTRIKSHVYLPAHKIKVDVTDAVFSPTLELVPENESFGPGTGFRIVTGSFSRRVSFYANDDSSIQFLGSRVIIRARWFKEDGVQRYIYWCFQINNN